MNIYNNRINILLKIFYKIICSFFSIITLLSESFLDIRSTKENRRIKHQSTIRDRKEKTTAIRLFEMIQKGITVIFVQLCVLLYSLTAFFKFYLEIIQVKKFNHSLMVGANHKAMNLHNKCHIFVALLIEALWEFSFAERSIRCPIISYL